MKRKLSLKDRAERFALDATAKKPGRPFEPLVLGFLAGYRAARKDVHNSAYARRWCSVCARPNDGHKHEFCEQCRRVAERCGCKLCPDCKGRFRSRRLFYKWCGLWYCKPHLMAMALRGRHDFTKKPKGPPAVRIRGLSWSGVGEEVGDP